VAVAEHRGGLPKTADDIELASGAPMLLLLLLFLQQKQCPRVYLMCAADLELQGARCLAWPRQGRPQQCGGTQDEEGRRSSTSRSRDRSRRHQTSVVLRRITVHVCCAMKM
jgi:hypothetical protein